MRFINGLNANMKNKIIFLFTFLAFISVLFLVNNIVNTNGMMENMVSSSPDNIGNMYNISKFNYDNMKDEIKNSKLNLSPAQQGYVLAYLQENNVYNETPPSFDPQLIHALLNQQKQ
jgi:hypothetical protein